MFLPQFARSWRNVLPHVLRHASVRESWPIATLPQQRGWYGTLLAATPPKPATWRTPDTGTHKSNHSTIMVLRNSETFEQKFLFARTTTILFAINLYVRVYMSTSDVLHYTLEIASTIDRSSGISGWRTMCEKKNWQCSEACDHTTWIGNVVKSGCDW